MVRSAGGPIPWIRLDAGEEDPLYVQLTDALRRAILHGRLAPGTRLPSSRNLAADLDVSRTTVIQAYERLELEGYLEARVGDGTYVSGELSDTLLPVQETRRFDDEKPQAAAREEEHAALPPASERVRRLGERLRDPAHSREKPRPFLPGVPDFAAFPRDIWSRLSGRRLRELEPRDLALGDPSGLPELRLQIARHLAVTRGVTCEPEQVVITNGAQQALALSAYVLVDSGDLLAVEEPGYLGARRAFSFAEARLMPVGVDGEGIRVSELRASGEEPRAAYVTPSRQFPTGAPLTLGRRLELLNWAREAGAWIIEDDYDGEYRFQGRPLQALHGLDAGQRVVYVATFSKILFPSLRIGYAVVPPALVDAFVACRRAFDEQPSLLQQITLAEFMEEGHFARHVRRMRRLYRKRRDALLEAMEEELGDLVRVGPADAGMHVAVWLPPDVDDRAVQVAAAERGVSAHAVSTFCMEPSVEPEVEPGLVLGFAGYTPDEMKRGMASLGEAVHSVV